MHSDVGTRTSLPSHIHQLAKRGAAFLALLAMLASALVASAAPAAASYYENLGSGAFRVGNTYYCDSKVVTPSYDVVVKGTYGDDVILAMGEDVKVVKGFHGNDVICVVTPGVAIYGHSGDDRIYTPNLDEDWADSYYDPQVTTTYGGPGDDYILGGSGDDNISGAEGDDVLLGGDGVDYLWGGSGSDYFDGQGGDRDLCHDYTTNDEFQRNCERGASDDAASQQMPLHSFPLSHLCQTSETVLPDGTVLSSIDCPWGYSSFR